MLPKFDESFIVTVPITQRFYCFMSTTRSRSVCLSGLVCVSADSLLILNKYVYKTSVISEPLSDLCMFETYSSKEELIMQITKKSSRTGAQANATWTNKDK